jgi:hypothetical protein
MAEKESQPFFNEKMAILWQITIFFNRIKKLLHV